MVEEFMVEEFMAEGFMVEVSGVEKSWVEISRVEMSSNLFICPLAPSLIFWSSFGVAKLWITAISGLVCINSSLNGPSFK